MATLRVFRSTTIVPDIRGKTIVQAAELITHRLRHVVPDLQDALGPAGAEGSERWKAWLEQLPLPLIRGVNPYRLLRMTEAEIGGGYDFDDLRKLPPYVPRREDEELDRILKPRKKKGGLVLIIGPSKSGKSRAAFEVLRRQSPGRRLLVPRVDKPESAGEILRDYARLAADLGIDNGTAVLWLDNLHGTLSTLTTAVPDIRLTLEHLTNDRQLLIMATMWKSEHDRIEKVTGAHPKETLDRQSGEVLWLAQKNKTTVELTETSFASGKSNIEKVYPRSKFPKIWYYLDRGEDLAASMIAWPLMLENLRMHRRSWERCSALQSICAAPGF